MFSGLDFEASSGEVLAVVGPNGSGKTSLLRLIAGLLVPSEGRIVLDGIDVARDPEGAKSRLAYIPDRPYVPERLSARELLSYYEPELHRLLFEVKR